MKEEEFLKEVKEINLLNQAINLLDWDMQTGMPEVSSNFRGDVIGYLSKMQFEKATGPKIKEALTYFNGHPENLSEVGIQILENVKENYLLNHSIPVERMQEYKTTLTTAHEAWINARHTKSFNDMQESIEKIVTFLKEFIPYWRKDEKTPYDVLLNQYEPELTVEKLDKIFSELKTGIMAIRQTIDKKGIAPRTDFLSRKVTKEQQHKFVMGIVKQLGYDFSKGRLDDTVHPFMIGLNRKDARITSRWYEDNFKMAVFGCMHEAGHGIYEQNIDKKYDYSPLSTGASMGIHESQSLFNEIIIGGNKQFWIKQYPFFKECTEGMFDDIDLDTFYNGLKETKASLIRIEADSLTYPLHIIIRYEIEKLIFNNDVSISELPQIWNDKYKEYLGISPENDLEGILQDVHWSAGNFGYFPSYALGYMYAAQFQNAMKKDILFDEVLSTDDYTPIRKWLTENIHQFGASKKPNQLIQEVTGETLNPSYLIDYMKKLYYNVYQIEK